MRPIELVDARLYHLDLTFCPLDDRRALVAPDAWDRYGRKVVEALVPEPLVLEADEVLAFCANSVVVGTTVVMPSCPPRVGRQLEAWGFDVAVVAVGEFQKAGGGCRCLTLALDVDLGVSPAAAWRGEPPQRGELGDVAMEEHADRPVAYDAGPPAGGRHHQQVVGAAHRPRRPALEQELAYLGGALPPPEGDGQAPVSGT